MREYIDKDKLLELLRSDLAAVKSVHHDHVDSEVLVYEHIINKISGIRGCDLIKEVKDGTKT